MKYKKAPAHMGKTLTIYVGNGDRRVLDHEIIESGDLERFVKMGMLVHAEPKAVVAAAKAEEADASLEAKAEAEAAEAEAAEAKAEAEAEAAEAKAEAEAEAAEAEAKAANVSSASDSSDQGVTKSAADKIAAAAPKSKRGRKG